MEERFALLSGDMKLLFEKKVVRKTLIALSNEAESGR